MLNENAKFRIKGMLIVGAGSVVLGVTGIPALVIISQAGLIGSTIWGAGGFLMDQFIPTKKSNTSTIEHEKDDFDKYYGGN